MPTNADPVVAAIAEGVAKALQISNSQAKNLQANNIQLRNRRMKATYSSTTQYAHGPSGVFNVSGVDRDVFPVVPRPLGISSKLPMVRSEFMDSKFELLMPVTAGTGSEPANDCATAPKPGKATVGFQRFPFGKIIRETETVDVNRVGQRVDNAEPIDLQLVSDLASVSPWVPDPARDPNILNSELGLKYFTLGLEFEREVEDDVFTGNPSSNDPATEGRKYFAGLTAIINTGKIDAEYGSPLTGLDSLLVNWSNGYYNGTVTLNGQVADIVTTISAMMNYLKARARITNVRQADWALSMRYDLFYALTAVWPCSYLTNGCTTTGVNLIAVNGAEQVEMRDAMRTEGSEFLWINGIKYPVWITDQATETTAAGKRVSDIFFIPIRVDGRFATYFEFFNFQNEQINEWDSSVGPMNRRWSSNNGLFYWTYDQTRYCESLVAKVQSRLIMRRTDLAARLQNVGYLAVVPTNVSQPGALYSIPSGVSIGQSGGLYNGF